MSIKWINAKMVLRVPQFYFKIDYPDQSNQKQNWHTRFKTEQKHSWENCTRRRCFSRKEDTWYVWFHESNIIYIRGLLWWQKGSHFLKFELVNKRSVLLILSGFYEKDPLLSTLWVTKAITVVKIVSDNTATNHIFWHTSSIMGWNQFWYEHSHFLLR